MNIRLKKDQNLPADNETVSKCKLKMILSSKSSIHPSMLGNAIVKQDKLKKLKNLEQFMTPQQNQVKCSYASLSLDQYMIASDILLRITNLTQQKNPSYCSQLENI